MSILRPPIALAYHGVGSYSEKTDPERLIISPAHMEEQIAMLMKRGYAFMTAEELVDAHQGTKPDRPVAVLTFDDGLADNLTIAARVLDRIGVRATFYICPGLWGAQHEHVRGEAGRLLTEDEARRLHEAGMELGGHSMTHPDLRKLDDDELRRELADCKTAIESITSRPCRTFAYPYGLFGPREEEAVAAAGYELAFAWLPGRWRRYATPRMPAPPRNGARRLALKMLGIRRPGP